ncbi:MAG: hypothetical protein FJ138_15155, partial [Deltaproteobacteria bacterium]|nr:hypothetical protein [Deltaproteobacteria bacterium]
MLDPRDDEREGLDLTPLLYPEEFSAEERGAARRALEAGGAEARAALARLEEARAALSAAAARRGARAGGLAEGRRRALLAEASRAAAEARAAAAPSWADSLARWLLGPQVAWAGALCLALAGAWVYRGAHPDAPAVRAGSALLEDPPAPAPAPLSAPADAPVQEPIAGAPLLPAAP